VRSTVTAVQDTARNAGALGVLYWDPTWYAIAGNGWDPANLNGAGDQWTTWRSSPGRGT
jgi:arabinogalactan endo-1,4-beta-galactosidase